MRKILTFLKYQEFSDLFSQPIKSKVLFILFAGELFDGNRYMEHIQQW